MTIQVHKSDGFVIKIGTNQISMPPNHLFISFVIFSFLSFGSAFADSNSVDFTVENGILKVGSNHTPFDSITAESRVAILPNLRTFLSSTNSELRSAVAHALLKENDQQTADILAEMYHDHNDSVAYSYLGLYGNETVIPLVIPDIYNSHEKIFRLPSGGPTNISAASSGLVLGLIQQSDKFPAATKTWARATALYLGIRGHIRLVTDQERQWWEHNKDAILAGQYDKATWLPDATLDVALGSPPQQLPTPFPRKTPSVGESNAPVGQSLGAKFGIVIPASSASSWIYFVGLLAAGGLVGLGFWYIRRGR